MYSYRIGPKPRNSTLNFDPDTFRGRITPSLASAELTAINQFANGGEAVYSGSNCKVMLEMRQLAANGAPRFNKQLLELTTLSVSVHAAGYINPRGIARGGRTVAGAMVMTKFAAEVLLRFLASGLIGDNQVPSSDETKSSSRAGASRSETQYLGHAPAPEEPASPCERLATCTEPDVLV
jgi:hypothetical protein